MKYEDLYLQTKELDGVTVRAPLKCAELGSGRYRVGAIPFPFESLNYGDEFEGEMKGDVLHVVRVVRRSGWTTNLFIMDYHDKKQSWLPKVEAKVDELGGLRDWFCGLLAISLPPGVEYDPLPDMRTDE